MRAVTLAVVLCFALAAPAAADIAITVTTLRVQVGGTLRGHGNGSGFPVYLVPESRAPHPYPCHGNGYCAPRSWHPPRKPYVFLGRFRRTRSNYTPQRFAFRVPAVRPGRYQVAVWCRPCGRTLILAGSTLNGQVVTVHR